MAEITEAQARRICEAVYYGASREDRWQNAVDWPEYPAHPNPIGEGDIARVPLWRIVQRAAAEGGDNDAEDVG